MDAVGTTILIPSVSHTSQYIMLAGYDRNRVFIKITNEMLHAFLTVCVSI